MNQFIDSYHLFLDVSIVVIHFLSNRRFHLSCISFRVSSERSNFRSINFVFSIPSLRPSIKVNFNLFISNSNNLWKAPLIDRVSRIYPIFLFDLVKNAVFWSRFNSIFQWQVFKLCLCLNSHFLVSNGIRIHSFIFLLFAYFHFLVDH